MTDEANGVSSATTNQSHIRFTERSWLLGLVGLGVLVLSWIVSGLLLPLLVNIGIDNVVVPAAYSFSTVGLPMIAAVLIVAWIMAKVRRGAAQSDDSSDASEG
jgi:hypothetical protein